MPERRKWRRSLPTSGERKVVGHPVAAAESAALMTVFLRCLVARRLAGVRLVADTEGQVFAVERVDLGHLAGRAPPWNSEASQ